MCTEGGSAAVLERPLTSTTRVFKGGSLVNVLYSHPGAAPAISPSFPILLFRTLDTSPVYYLRLPPPFSSLSRCLSAVPALAIFVCGCSLQQLINSSSPPPPSPAFREPHNNRRAEPVRLLKEVGLAGSSNLPWHWVLSAEGS